MYRFTQALSVPPSLRAAALAAGCAAVLAATPSGRAQAETETRSVIGFDEVVSTVSAEVSIEQGPRESLTLEAEPAVLRKITTEVHGRRLLIGLAPGKVETQQPIRVKLGVQSLRAFESRAIGATSIGPLRSDALALVLAGSGSIRVERLESARTLDVRITGSGDVAVGGGRVTAQQLDIAGIGTYSAPRLASERAAVAIDGNGEAQLAASTMLAVRIGGIGHVRYHGDPAVTRSIRGIGSVDKD